MTGQTFWEIIYQQGGVSGMAGYDYTYAERMRRMRRKRRDEGLVEVRERVPSDLVSELKRIAAEMRNPETAEAYRQALPKSQLDK
jgi:hypothetical protein